jgi:hypothetical protein
MKRRDVCRSLHIPRTFVWMILYIASLYWWTQGTTNCSLSSTPSLKTQGSNNGSVLLQFEGGVPADVTTRNGNNDDNAKRRAWEQAMLAKHRKATVELERVDSYAHKDTRHQTHPGLYPIDPHARPHPEWRNTHFPDINVVGLPKAGTTQLYNILVSHPRTVAFNPLNKEECFPGNYSDVLHGWDGFVFGEQPTAKQRALQGGLYSTLQNYHQENPQSFPHKLSVNGCLNGRIVAAVYDYLKPPATKKFIIALRDPADWLWAVYNFWAVQDVDVVIPEGEWAHREQHYRSPEMFHDLVASSHDMVFFDNMLGRRALAAFNYVWQFEAMVGRENILYIRNEDLLPGVVARPGGVLDQLAAFAGLNRKGFDSQTFGEISNCNDQKGFVKKCGTSKSNAYEITGGRSMLPETRTLIYLLYYEECKLWSQRYDVVYEDCLNVLEATKS